MILTKITFSTPDNSTVEVSSSFVQKCGISLFLPEERSQTYVYLFFFSQEWSYWTGDSRRSGEGSFTRKSKVLVPFLSDQKIEGQLAPSLAHFPPKSPNQNFEIAIFFSIVENSNNYVFEDDLTPTVPGGRAACYELCSVYLWCWLFERIQTFSRGIFLVRGSVCGRIFPLRKFSWGKGIYNGEGSRFPSIIQKTIRN